MRCKSWNLAAKRSQFTYTKRYYCKILSLLGVRLMRTQLARQAQNFMCFFSPMGAPPEREKPP